jgi:DHA2 family methylenomycin A resistance protein-like MFS transporter
MPPPYYGNSSARAETILAYGGSMLATATRGRQRPAGAPLVAVSLGYFMVILDATIVTVALPALGRDLGAGVAGLQWVVDAYALAFAGLLLLGGSLSDRFGSRAVFQASLVAFTLASAACGLAPSLGALVAARAVQGAGAAAVVPSSLALLRAAYPDGRARARAFGVWGGIAGVAAASGPVLGGALTAWLSWRAVFAVNLPVGASALWLTGRQVIASSRRQGASGIDPLGQLAAVASLGGLVVALIHGGEAGWRAPLVLAGLAGFVAFGAAWLLVERRAGEPMVPLELFRRPAFSGATAVGLLLNLGFYGQLFVLSLYLQRVRGDPPALAGVALLPEALAVLAGSPLSGRVTGRTGPRLPMTAGMLAGAAGFAALALAGPGTAYPLLLAPMVAVGFGTSFTMPAATAAVIAAAPADRAGLASGVLNAGRQVGGAVGVALLGGFVAAGRPFAPGMHAAMLLAAAAFAAGAALAWPTAQRVA